MVGEFSASEPNSGVHRQGLYLTSLQDFQMAVWTNYTPVFTPYRGLDECNVATQNCSGLGECVPGIAFAAFLGDPNVRIFLFCTWQILGNWMQMCGLSNHGVQLFCQLFFLRCLGCEWTRLLECMIQSRVRLIGLDQYLFLGDFCVTVCGGNFPTNQTSPMVFQWGTFYLANCLKGYKQ